jgi:hypothetical protein
VVKSVGIKPVPEGRNVGREKTYGAHTVTK